MKLRVSFIVRALCSLAAVLLLASCKTSQPMARDLETASRQLDGIADPALPAASGSPSPSPDGPTHHGGFSQRPPMMDVSQARSILREDAAARALPDAPDEPTRFAELAKTESYQHLIAEAHAAFQESGAESEAVRRGLETPPLEEQQKISAEAKKYLLGATSDFEKATAAYALADIAGGEAALETFHHDLVALLPDEVDLPSNIFEWATPPHLESARDNLRQNLGRLKIMDALVPDGTLTATIAATEKKLAAIDAAIASPRRQALLTKADHLFKKIDPHRWQDLASTRETRTRARREGLLSEIAAETGFQELQFASFKPRGPPDTLAKVFAHDYDIDPAGWSEAKAEFDAWDEELRNDPNVPENLRAAEVDPCERFATALDDPTLERIERDAARMVKPDGGHLPSQLLHPEKEQFASRFRQAAMNERQRRLAGGKQVPVDTSRFLTPSPAVKARVDAYRMHVAFERFPPGMPMPPALHAEVQRITAETVHEYTKSTAENLERFSAYTRNVALSSYVPSDEEMKAHADAKAAIASAADETRRIIQEAKARGIEVHADEARLSVAIALLPRPPPEPPDIDPPAVPGPTGPGPAPVHPIGGGMIEPVPAVPGGGNGKIDRYQVAIEKNFFVFNKAMASLESRAANVTPLRADPIGTSKGRLTAAEVALRAPNFDARKLAADTTRNRLPANVEKWSGRLDENNRPFSYADDVKHPKSFDALGGGIHMGESAQYTGKDDLGHAVLVYESGKGLLLRDGNSGAEWVIDARTDPTSLRALYRFAVSGRNAAISIGWGQERESFKKLLQTLEDGEQAVLLDPFLVDTTVGQNLIVADSIPWELDKVAGVKEQPVSFHAPFAAAKTGYATAGKQQIESFLDQVKAVAPGEERTLAPRLAAANLPDLALAAFKFDSLDEAGALEWIVDRQIDELLRDASGELPNATLESGHTLTATQRLTDRLALKYTQQIKADIHPGPGYGIDQQKVRQVAREEADKAVKKIKAELQAEAVKTYGGGMAELRLPLLQEMVIVSITDPKKPNRDLVEAWAALSLGRGESKAKVAQTLLLFLNATTLAILYDDHVSFALQDGKAAFTTQMRYRYATTHIEVTDQRIGLGRDDKGSEVQTLGELTDLVNAHMPELLGEFPYLARIEQYANTTAFFRWADGAAKTGALGLVDLSGLFASPPNDRTNFPTIDVIKSR